MIIFDKLSLSASGKKVLDSISLTFPDGIIAGISGPAGSGKTSLVETMKNIPDRNIEGSLIIDSINTLKLKSSERNRIISFFSQDTCRINMESSVFDTILKGRAIYKKTLSPYSREDRDFTEKTVNLFRLSAVKSEKLKNLSSSLLQLTMIAQAVNRQCPILVLSSPERDLNIDQLQIIIMAFKNYISTAKKTVIIESNNINFICSVCDKIIFLKKGRIHCDVSPFDINDKMIMEIFGANTSVSKNIITGRPEIQLIDNI